MFPRISWRGCVAAAALMLLGACAAGGHHGASGRGLAQLPPPSDLDPTIAFATDYPTASVSGSAGALGASLWLTARHVVEGCDRVVLIHGPKLAMATDVVLHPSADVALFRTEGPIGTALPVLLDEGALQVGQSGTAYGYPAGRLGAVRSVLLGRLTKVVSGTYAAREPALAWKETAGTRAEGALGGISGAPILDSEGRVVGVLAQASRERRHTLSVPPSAVREVLALAGATPEATAGRTAPAGSDLAADAERLAETGSIAKVVCWIARGEAPGPSVPWAYPP